jgi:aminoglycoside 2''-phosphotransferase
MQLEALSARLATAFPELVDPADCRVLASGFRSTVVESGGAVFRIGKNEAATQGFAREVSLLPVLKGRLPMPVPEPLWYGPPSTLFPFGVRGYRKLPGVPLSPERLSPSHRSQVAQNIASFLVALHTFSIRDAMALGIPEDRGPAARLASMERDVLSVLRRLLTEQEYARLERWWQAVSADVTLDSYEPVLRHGDLWYENILFVETTGEVTGILDFEHASVGDRAQDLATQLHMGVDFARLVVDHYREANGALEAGFEHRMEVWWQLRELTGVEFALQIKDNIELEDAIRKLRRGPVLGTSQSS